MESLLAKIETIAGPTGLIAGDDVSKRPGDWLGFTPCAAAAIIRPASTQELAQIMQLCHERGQAVVPAGGLTGLAGGAKAAQGELMISMERMAAIEEVDPVGRTITVEAGCPLQKAQEAAAEQNMLLPIDFGARGSATIGGAVSTNAGGNNVIRYGMMRNQTLGLEAVLADGTILTSMNRMLKNNSGYDLKQLFIGTEGTLGLVTRAILRLTPLPKSVNTALIGIEDFDKLVAFFNFAGAQFADALTAFEVMWKEHYEIVAITSGRHQAPMENKYAYYVVVETNGSDDTRDGEFFTETLAAALDQKLAADAVVAGSKAQRDGIWAIREDIEALAAAIMPGAVFDVSLPISAMKDYVEVVRTDMQKQWPGDNRVIVFGHLGDGNLHIGVTARPWDEAVHRAVEEVVYRPLQMIGGAISAEHGVGLEKRDYLGVSRSDAEIELMRRLKTCLDPKNILNPGKIFEI